MISKQLLRLALRQRNNFVTRGLHHQRSIINKSSKVETHFDKNTLRMSLRLADVVSRRDMPYVWLRDHCSCEKCYNAATKQIEHNVVRLDLNSHPVHVRQENENIFEITWQDGHTSRYDMIEVAKNVFEREIMKYDDEDVLKPVLWDKNKISQVFKRDCMFNYDEFQFDKATLAEAFKALILYGAVIVEKVPAEKKILSKVCERISTVQKTIYGTECVVTSGQMDYADTAYSSCALRAHNDGTYMRNSGGLMGFHLIENQGKGGASLLVDGYHCANELRLTHPNAFRILSETSVPAQYQDSGHHHMRYCDKVIKLNQYNEVCQIRYNTYDRASLNHLSANELLEYYKALQQFGRIVEQPSNEFWFHLKPDQVLVLDNYRLLHGRSAIDAKRTLASVYLKHDEFLSNARTFTKKRVVHY